MNIGSTAGFPGVNTDINEWCTEATDSFSPPIVEKNLLKGNSVFHHPISTITEDSTIEFSIRKDQTNYIDLTKTLLHGSFQIVKKDGTNIGDSAADDVSIANQMPQCLFKQIDVHINDVSVVDQSTSTYSWKAFFNNFLSYGGGVKKTKLKATQCYLDDDATEGLTSKNKCADSEALLERNKWITGSKPCYFTMEIHCDVLKCERFLPPDCDMKFIFHRNAAQFGIISPQDDYKVKLSTDLKLEMYKISCADSVLKQYETNILKNSAKFFFRQSKIKTFVIPQGNTSYTVGMINGNNARLPTQLIFGFLRTEAYSGSVFHNPFNFYHFKLNQFALRVNGELINNKEYTPNFTSGKYVREYNSLMENIGIGNSNWDLDYSIEKFVNGKTLFAFDLNPDRCNNEHLHISTFGNINLEVSFAEALPNTVQLLCYMSFSAGFTLEDTNAVTLVQI